jgi:hypothetical protein
MSTISSCPKDITKYVTGKYKPQSGRDFYSKLMNEAHESSLIYFRISVANMHNSTVVFLADSSGNFIHDDLTIDLGKHWEYPNAYFLDDGRCVLHDADNASAEAALWAMSDYNDLYLAGKHFEKKAPALIMRYAKDTKREVFEELFGSHIELYQRLLDVTKTDDLRVDDNTLDTEIMDMVSILKSVTVDAQS